MNNLTRFFLVLVRLSIGWLFLFEGVEKVKSLDYPSTGWIRPWSSAGYLRESSGPVSSFFQWQAGGNADEKALERFTLWPLADGQDPAATPPRERVAPDLAADWGAYVERYGEHYGFDDGQKKQAQAALEDNLDRTARWLLGDALRDDEGSKSRESTKEGENAEWPTATFRTRRTFAQDVAAYKNKLDEVRRAQDEALPVFGKDVAGGRLRSLKADAAKMRTSLLAELEEPLRIELGKLLTDAQKKVPAFRPAGDGPAVLRWTDCAVSYGLLAVGGGLLLGLFTRLSCVAGALFLVMLYLAMPALPWLPENLKAEGHYLFVSKNLILALALLGLATTRSGLWFGLDGLLRFLNPFRRRRPAPAHSSR